MAGRAGGGQAGMPNLSMVLAPEYQVPPPIRKPENLHPLPDNIDAYCAYPFSAEDLVTSGRTFGTSQNVAALRERHDTYLATRRARKEQEAQERIRRMAPGWVPDQVLQPTPAQPLQPETRTDERLATSESAGKEQRAAHTTAPAPALAAHPTLSLCEAESVFRAEVEAPDASSHEPPHGPTDARVAPQSPLPTAEPALRESAVTPPPAMTVASSELRTHTPPVDATPATPVLAAPTDFPTTPSPEQRPPIPRPAAPTPLAAADPASHDPRTTAEDRELEELAADLNEL